MKKLTHIVVVLFVALAGNNGWGQFMEVVPLHQRINTPLYDEIAPCISPDGLVLYFTRVGSKRFDRTLIEDGRDVSLLLSPTQYMDRLRRIYSSLAGRSISNPVRSVFNQDVWMANTTTSDFDVVVHPEYPLNNALPNSISALLPLTNEVVVVNQFVANGGMRKGFSRSFMSADGRWNFPTPINIDNYHNSGPDVNLSISNDGQVMILSLERSDAIGQSDLYVSFKRSNGVWSEPKNLGSSVNTPFREATPHLSKDKKRIFYSSDRGQRNGTSDIYMQERIGNGWQSWSAPRKFIKPINSKASESHPYFCPATGELFFCSDRQGNWDIFKVQIDQPEQNLLRVKGIVVNKKNGEPIKGARILCSSPRGHPSVRYTSTAGFLMAMPWNSKITITADKENFLEESIVLVSGPPMNTNYIKEIQLELQPVKDFRGKECAIQIKTTQSARQQQIRDKPRVGKKIELRPIYFEQSKPIVRSESHKEIDRLAAYLNLYPGIYIRIAGHTDNQGEEAALQKLSEDRAKAIKDYLVYKKFINPVRIETVGFGASHPVNNNSTETLRRQNRRVEVEITYVGNSATGGTK